ncbi:hypothetical protein A6F68_00173 [Tsuneonella dongtanensis]|uniref:Uncharacterized protein n=1 Tax=Tsuneonella dongtanensis TaxID=692370 RepID=A0A1B2A9F2_9SPHN|nr:hypothetical protein [Tsuneonella dongtanensis]ANY18708.1 hypothetical protein A6F68_00173 [Tsuneonella dongtanensis]
MTRTNNNIAAACIALLLTLATFQQAIVIPSDHTPSIATAQLA